MLLARRAGLLHLVTALVKIPGGAGADPAAKVSSIVAGMLASADSIDDLAVLREGAVAKVLPGVKAPSTPAVVPTRLHLRLCPATRRDRRDPPHRPRSSNDLRATGLGAFDNHSVVAAVLAAGARFSITARMDPAITTAISAIPDDAWVSMKYPQAIFDQEQQRWISDAQARRNHLHRVHVQVAETPHHRPVDRPAGETPQSRDRQGQGELFTVDRFHAVFTNSCEPTLIAEAHHRDHAIVEQVIADLKSSALKHFPSGVFNANATWLTCAVIAYNLTRAAALTKTSFGKARTLTFRAVLVNIPARIAYSGRVHTLHLPVGSHRETLFNKMFDAIMAPPQTA